MLLGTVKILPRSMSQKVDVWFSACQQGGLNFSFVACPEL
jgi:hypothetical protein